MSCTYLDAVLRPEQDVNRLFRFLGAVLTSAQGGEASIELPVSPHMAQGGGLIAGGILATLADEAMAHACISLLQPNQSTVTVEMNIRYLRSAAPSQDGRLTAKATVVKPGRQTMVAKAGVYDAAGRFLADAGGTFWVR